MSVSGVSSNSATNDVAALMRTMRASMSAVDTTESGSDAERTDSTTISGPAEFMNKLQKLKETDPEQFKEVVQGVADKLTSAAESATDERSKKMLTSLAEKFSSVADGGDLSQLEPPKPSSLSSNGQKAYGAGQSGQSMMSQMMGGPQGPPPGPPPSSGSDSTESTDSTGSSDSADRTTQASGTDLRDTLKSIFDELNSSLTEALAQ
jgi:hypothetical protein